jgi:hypothetical protein
VPGDVTADQLDPQAAAELRTLPGDLADAVARYLVAAGREEDPERAYEYARAARGLAARVGIVRETSAIAAYQAGKWADALAEFRAARRLTGRDSYLPLMADSERALGRLDRALDLVTGPEARAADRATQLELLIVESGIRRDQGLAEAAVVALQVPELKERRGRAGNARLLYAYADALLEAGREEEAREWFGRAAAADTAGETDAADRVDELDDVLFEDLDDSDEDDESDEDLDDSEEDDDSEDEELDDEDDLEEVDDLDEDAEDSEDDESDEDAEDDSDEDDDSEDDELDDEDDLEEIDDLDEDAEDSEDDDSDEDDAEDDSDEDDDSEDEELDDEDDLEEIDDLDEDAEDDDSDGDDDSDEDAEDDSDEDDDSEGSEDEDLDEADDLEEVDDLEKDKGDPAD